MNKKIVSTADSLHTLKSAQQGDVLMFLDNNSVYSMQIVQARVGIRGKTTGRVETRVMNVDTGVVSELILRDSLPENIVMVVGVKIPRREGGQARGGARPSGSEMRVVKTGEPVSESRAESSVATHRSESNADSESTSAENMVDNSETQE